MSQYNSGLKAFTSGEALTARARVKLSSSTVVYADAGEDFVGVTEHACASGDIVTVKLKNVSGTFKVTASEAFAVETVLYGADDGRVADTENGSAQFYSLEAATAAGDIVEALPLDGASQAVHIGSSTTSVTLSAAGKSAVAIYTTCASTSGSTSVEPVYVKSTMTGAGGVGGRCRFHTYSNVASGGWINALKGFMEFGASGRTTGLASAICAETQLSAGTSGSAYCALEAELVLPSGASTGERTSFLYCNASGAGVATFDTNGYFLHVGDGITAAAGKFCSANYHTLKCFFTDSSTTRYMFLSQTENGVGIGASGSEVSYTAGSPLMSLYATAAGSGSTNCEPLVVQSLLTGTSPVGGRSKFYCKAGVTCGGWVNALKGYMEFDTSGRCTGLASAVCVEMKLPNENITAAGGAYFPLEIEYVAAGSSLVTAGALTGNHAGFIYMAQSGDANGDFDANGFIMHIAGMTAGASNCFRTGLTAATLNGYCTAALRIGVGSTTYYIPLATATA